MALLIIVLGLVIGSFIGAYTYRVTHDEDISKGRSKCPQCKKVIVWYDNIPVLSYILLGGKCRNCHKKISMRYPFIEFSTAVLFGLAYYAVKNCSSALVCSYSETWGILHLPIILFVVSVLIAIFVTDIEKQIIPDALVFLLFGGLAIIFILFINESFYVNLFTGFAAASFLLVLNLATKGRGMGLGDVKFAVPIGLLLGYPYTLYWLSTSFIIGSIVGIILILFGKARFGKHIAFGPFLVVSFFIVFFLSNYFDALIPL